MGAKAFDIVVAGGGQAGARAIQGLREAGFAGSVMLLSEESEFPYERPPLSKEFLTQPDQAAVKHALDPAFYPSNAIAVELNAHVEELRLRDREIVCADGRAFTYGRLVIATGARPRRPGVDAPPLLYLRNISDARSISEALAPGRRVAVIGGGLIGLEVAAAAQKRGAHATVLEAGPQVLGRFAPRVVSSFVEAFHRSKGVQVLTSAQPTAIEKTRDAYIVRYGAGVLEADAIIAGVGVVPNTELAQRAGLEVANGIVTNEFGLTSDPAVYAAGDVVCQHHPLLKKHVRLEAWQNAQDQGLNVGRTLAGTPTPSAAPPWAWSDQFDLNLQSAGMASASADIVVRGDPSAGSFAAFSVEGDRLAGAVAVNRGREMPLIMRLLASGAPIDRARLADGSASLREGLQSPQPQAAKPAAPGEQPIVILVASMSGKAEMVADEIAGKLRALGKVARVVRMEKGSLEMLRQRRTYVICSSTYGTGDVPDNGQPFYDLLTREKPDLSAVRYGVVALGDMTYSASFCGGGAKFDEIFSALGARRLVQRLEHDARSGIYPETAALEWLDGWLAALRREDAKASCVKCDSRFGAT